MTWSSNLRLALLVGAAMLGCAPDAGRADSPRAQVTATAPAIEPLGYVERCFGATCDAELPTLVAIHGLGDTPEAFVGVFEGLTGPVRVLALRAPIEWGQGFAWFPYRTRTSAPDTIARALRGIVPRVLATVDRVCETRRCRGLPVVSGFSQGGMTSFAIAALAPTRIRVALPVSGFLPEGLDAIEAPSRPPVHAFHGQVDDVVPLALDLAGVERLRAQGYDVSLRVFPDVRHTIPPVLRVELLQAIDAALVR